MVIHVHDEILAHDSQTNQCNVCSVGRGEIITFTAGLSHVLYNKYTSSVLPFPHIQIFYNSIFLCVFHHLSLKQLNHEFKVRQIWNTRDFNGVWLSAQQTLYLLNRSVFTQSVSFISTTHWSRLANKLTALLHNCWTFTFDKNGPQSQEFGIWSGRNMSILMAAKRSITKLVLKLTQPWCSACTGSVKLPCWNDSQPHAPAHFSEFLLAPLLPCSPHSVTEGGDARSATYAHVVSPIT